MKYLRFSPIALLAVFVLFAACESPQDDTVVVDADTTSVFDDNVIADDTLGTAQGNVTVEETNAALEGGVANVELNAAQRNVNNWIVRLENTDDFENRGSIIGGLEDLRDALGESPIDGERVGGILADLGQWTSEAGMTAGNAGVQRLGELLSSAATNLGAGASTTEPAM